MAIPEDVLDRLASDVAAGIANAGPEGFTAETIAKRYIDEGYSRATVYRWIKRAMEGGAARRVGAKVKAAEGETITGSPSVPSVRPGPRMLPPPVPASEIPAEAVSTIVEPPVSMDRMAASGAIPFVARIMELIRQAEEVMAFARHSTGPMAGKIRLPKTLIAGMREYRALLETALRWQEKQADQSRLEAFHAAVVAEVRLESPECAARIVKRLLALNASRGLI